MIILQNLNGKLPIIPYCSRIILDNPDVHVTIDNQKIYLINIIKEYFEPYLLDSHYKKIDKETRHKDLFIGCSCWKYMDQNSIKNSLILEDYFIKRLILICSIFG